MTHPDLPPIQVLLVEDDAGDALLVEEHFSRTTMLVAIHRASSLAAAIEAGRIRIDCVLLDLALPDAQDLEALTAVLRTFDAPVVVLTGFSDHDLGVAAVAAGAEDYLAKNEVDPALLERSVRYAIERYRTKDTAKQLFAAELRREENLRLERGLLPRPLLDDERLTATTRYRAGGGNRVLGGDFFDTVQLADGSVRAVIGDVCGHGPDQAALGVSLRIAWRTLVLADVAEDRVLPMLQRLLVVERTEDLFVTVCDITITSDRAALRYRLAGHPAPLFIDGTGIAELDGGKRGLPLGIETGDGWPDHVIELAPEWTLLMFTDGLFEGRTGPGPARLGVDGLIRMLADLLPIDESGDQVDRLLELVETANGGPLDDDVAVLQLRSPRRSVTGSPTPTRSDRTLRRQVAVAFGFTAALAVVSLLLVGWAFQRQIQARGDVINRIDPAALAARDVFAALVDQETAVRGFALSRDEQFLAPYATGRQEETQKVRQLRRLISGDEELERGTADLEASARRWRESSASRLIAVVESGRTNLENTAILERSKTQFDVIRDRYDRLVTQLGTARAAARDEMSTRTSQVVVLAGVVVALLVACAIVIWVGLRRLVLKPIDRLATDARLVTGGAVEHVIEPTGPRELADLGDDLEAMRRRIVDDLATAEHARLLLARQAHDLTRSNDELEQFAYVASHDLQEPLRKITSFCQILEQRYGDQLDERGKQYLDFAVDGAKRMQQLILDLLAFSRVGRTTSRFVPVSLRASVEEACTNLEHLIDQHHAEIHFDDLPTVPGDPTLLISLFQNLISNSIKFNASEVPTVTFSARRTNDGWELACADNGIGIEPKHAARVFMIFQRLHGREDYEGTGIGLALCQKIVTYHGGTIWIDEDVTAGTTIRWTFPTNHPGAPQP